MPLRREKVPSTARRPPGSIGVSALSARGAVDLVVGDFVSGESRVEKSDPADRFSLRFAPVTVVSENALRLGHLNVPAQTRNSKPLLRNPASKARSRSRGFAVPATNVSGDSRIFKKVWNVVIDSASVPRPSWWRAKTRRAKGRRAKRFQIKSRRKKMTNSDNQQAVAVKTRINAGQGPPGSITTPNRS